MNKSPPSESQSQQSFSARVAEEKKRADLFSDSSIDVIRLQGSKITPHALASDLISIKASRFSSSVASGTVDAPSTVPVFISSTPWYCEALSLRMNRSSERQQFLQWLFTDTNAANLRHCMQCARSVLSVGAGTGEMDVQLLDLFPSCTEYVLLEPNAIFLEEAKQRIQVWQHHSACVGKTTFTFVAETWEQWSRKQFPNEKTFDWIWMSHVLYYFEDHQTILRQMILRSANLLVVHQTPTGIHALQKEFQTGGAAHYSSNEIRNDLQNLCAQWKEWCIPAWVDTNGIEDVVLDFMMETHLTDAERKAVRGYLQRESDSDKKLYDPVAIFWIAHDTDESSLFH